VSRPQPSPSASAGARPESLTLIPFSSDLSGFLDAHLTYIEQYRDILLDIKKDWSASCVYPVPNAAPACAFAC